MASQEDTILHRWFEEVWNDGNADAIDKWLDPAARIYGLVDGNGNEVSGIEQFKSFHQSFRNAFPDIQVTVKDTVSEDDKVVARCTVKETHTGFGLGISPTNKSVEFTGMCIVRVEHGMIVEAWNNFDFLTMFLQLGVMSLPATLDG